MLDILLEHDVASSLEAFIFSKYARSASLLRNTSMWPIFTQNGANGFSFLGTFFAQYIMIHLLSGSAKPRTSTFFATAADVASHMALPGPGDKHKVPHTEI